MTTETHSDAPTRGVKHSKLQYPYVLCGEAVTIGYMICVHIHSKADVNWHVPGKPTGTGVLCCATCKEIKDFCENNIVIGSPEWFTENFRFACKACLLEAGIIELEN